MKKSLLFMVTLFTILLISGCYNYSQGSQYGKIVDIKFYDLEYVEILGEWVALHPSNAEFNQTSKTIRLNSTIRPINSPAPNNMFYVTNIEEGTSIIARIIIKANNGYQFSSIVINSYLEIDRDDLYHIEEDEEFIYVDFLCENITQESRIYELRCFYMIKEFQSGTKKVTGSTWIEGRSYYSGFLFRLDENQTI